MAKDLKVTRAEPFVSPDVEEDRFLPEGPRPVSVDGREALAWVNIQTAADATAGAIHLRFWDTGELRRLPLANRPGFLLPTDRPNVVFVGMGKDVGTLDLSGNRWQALAAIPDENPRTIINDGEPTPDGSAVVFGTKDLDFADPIAKLYLFTPADAAVRELAGGMVCSNGKVFHAGSLFDIDTPRRRVTRYTLDDQDGTLTERGVAVDLAEIDGFPDGMADCGDGTVIIAMYNPEPVPAGRALRFDLTTGELLEAWETPGSPRVTCPLLIGRDGHVKLILTTATEGMPREQRQRCPNAGSLFIAETSFSGVPATSTLTLERSQRSSP